VNSSLLGAKRQFFKKAKKPSISAKGKGKVGKEELVWARHNRGRMHNTWGGRLKFGRTKDSIRKLKALR